MNTRQPCVYILASKKDRVIYTGVTSDLVKRIYQHKNNLTKGFSSKYYVCKLVYYELHDDMEQAILREKRIKSWNRQWKIELIEKTNNSWKDLYDDLF